MLKIFRKAIGGGGSNSSSQNTNSVSSLTPPTSQTDIQTNNKNNSPLKNTNVYTIKRDSKGFNLFSNQFKFIN